MINKLCEQIWNKPEFREDYLWASIVSAKLSFYVYDCPLDERLHIKIQRLLQCATIYSLSQEIAYREVAYKICVYIKNILAEDKIILEGEFNNYASVLALVFSRLGNFPAENKFVTETQGMNSSILLPESLWFERENHLLENTVEFTSGRKLTLTDFQQQLWDAVGSNSTVIVNAPTSAGKSFVLQNHIVHSLEENQIKNAIYIVPTRALIEQVIADFKSTIRKTIPNNEDILVTEVPNTDILLSHNIFVLTQERTQLLLEHDISIDLVVIDEAQNISDDARGIILQTVIEQLKGRNINLRTIFATPFVKNPDVFLSLFGVKDQKYKIIPMGEAPVSQNLYNVSVKINDLRNFEISKLDENGKFSFICNLQSEYELSDERKLLAIIPLCISKDQISIIYASEPSNCERIAGLISQAVASGSIAKIEDRELEEFSEYLKEHIHKDYLLAETIKNGVAYHYGNLPSFIRKGIERLCANGKIRYIVCTSTLLQGINLPAKNIFIMKPSKGRRDRVPIPLDGHDFWNLAGRAGRLTKDFEGNIFLINLQDWNVNPLSGDKRSQVISPSFFKYVCDPREGLSAFIKDKNHSSGNPSTQGLENAFMKLLLLHAENQLINLLDDLGDKLEIRQKNEIIEGIENAVGSITIPAEIFSKNPNVSVFRQEELYQLIKKRLAAEGPLSLIPPHPMQQYERIASFYFSLFEKYDRYLGKTSNRQYIYFSSLALLWMRGVSYHDLLSSRIDNKNKKLKRGRANVNTEARGLFQDIEAAIRFKYVKFSKCYNDLLSFALTESGHQVYIESIPPLHLFMEMGGSSNTMVNLMGMGISRTAAAIIVPHLISSNMRREEIISWVKHNNIYALGLPQSVISELEQL